MDFLVVGLGNPGEKYANNRHNLGFMVIDRLAEKKGVKLNKKKFKSIYGNTNNNDGKIHFIKPLTYMNKSGEAVRELKNFYKIPVENIIVIHDEMDLQPGRIRIKSGGGAAGHNGLRSIAGDLGTGDFIRVRIGVGKPLEKSGRTGFLLSDFSKNELENIDETIEKASQAVWEIITSDVPSAMNKYN